MFTIINRWYLTSALPDVPIYRKFPDFQNVNQNSSGKGDSCTLSLVPYHL